MLVVADQYPGNRINDIRAYFEYYKSQGIVYDYKIVPLTVTSAGKTIEPVMKVIDEAVTFGLGKDDVFVVVGGGTVTDIVGYSAALYDGGTPYIKIPTTLVGLIDAGIGVKVGVNFKDHKNFIGAYYAPAACLNDEAFLKTLSGKDMRCGISEAIKMALIKDRRLFELIERKHPDLQKAVFDEETDEIIRRSIEMMLEELQPNLYEENLRRLPDFGHEFGHIIEALSEYTIPHGEAVAIGMGISCCLAYRKDKFNKRDLKATLTLLSDVGLPIYDPCCNVDVLWEKCEEVVAHKGGKLYLVIPREIGKGDFIDELNEINKEMLSDAVWRLHRYANWHKAKRALLNTGLNVRAARKSFIFGDGRKPIELGYLRPTGISLPIDDEGIRKALKQQTRMLGRTLEAVLAEIDPTLATQIYYMPDDQIHITLVNYSNYRFPDRPFEMIPEEKIPLAKDIMMRYEPFHGRVMGIYLIENGIISAQVIADTYPIRELRKELIDALGIAPELSLTGEIWITMGRVLTDAKLSPLQVERINALIEGELLDHDFGEIKITYGKTTSGHTLFFGGKAEVG